MTPASATSVLSAPPDTTRHTPLDWSGRSAGLRYGGAVLLVAVAALLRAAMDRLFGGISGIYLTFYPAPVLAAVLGGLGPGILATVLSTAAATFLVPSLPGVGNGAHAVGSVIFSITGIGISALAQNRERTRRHGMYWMVINKLPS